MFAVPFPAGKAIILPSLAPAGRRHGADAIEFWKAECRRLADQLLAAGMPESDVGQRVLQFQQDVQSELVFSNQNGPLPKSKNR
ncbi:DUF6074 family protein, partial [Rhizobium ruizarguesonis]